MFVVFGIANPSAFLSQRNLINILSQSAILAMIAAGLTFPLVAGQFDLSFGAITSLSGIFVVGFLEREHIPVALAILCAALVAAGIGTVNGILVSYLRVNAVVATLGMSTILLGVNYSYSSGQPILINKPTFSRIAGSKLWGLPSPVFIMVALLFILWVLLNRTLLGHHTQAVGSNPVAARLAGVRVERITVIAFLIGGVCAGIGGIVLASRVGSGQVTAGDGYLLSAFAAAFLGASVLRDGEFHVFGTFIGVLIVTVTFNGLAIIGAQSWIQYVIQGGILILAVALSSFSRRILAGADR
jgi:ribose transport system permease protein